MLQVGDNCDFKVSKEYIVSYQLPAEYFAPGAAPLDWKEAKIDAAWFKDGDSKPYVAIEIDNYPYIKSIAKLKAAGAHLTIWIYLGDVELDEFNTEGIIILRPDPSQRCVWVESKPRDRKIATKKLRRGIVG
jgi:hypothetical protein